MMPRMPRRRIAFSATFVSVLLLAASCSTSGPEGTTEANQATTTSAVVETTTTTEAVAETTTTVAALPGEGVMVGMAYDIGGRGDKSFNDSAAAGLDQAVAEFGIDANELEASEVGENREAIVRVLAESGHELVIANGFAFADSVGVASTEYSDTSFAVVDAVVDAPNVLSLVFTENEGSALVGAAAALTTATSKIGFIGGVSGSGVIERFQAGYEAGAKEINPDIEIVVEYLSESPDASGFTDTEKARDVAQAMYEGGADVVFQAAGRAGSGVFEAARDVSKDTESKVWAIGSDTDQYITADAEVQPYILTSMIKRVDEAVFSTINNFVTGSEQSPVVTFDLAADGVGYSESGGFIDDIVDQIEALRERIVSGDLVIPKKPG